MTTSLTNNMDSAKRIILNTTAQYTKSVINICLSLYSTRLILNVLEVGDFGIYSVVGGVIGMLGFLTNSLVVTTQRYLSYYYGVGQKEFVKKIFANSLFLHIVIALILCSFLYIGEGLIFDKILNIDPLRLDAARHVYRVTIIMFVMSIITSPFKAVLIARENIVYISFVEILDGILKLGLAVSLFFFFSDKLMAYANGMTAIIVFNFLAFTFFVISRYDESHITWSRATIDLSCIKQLFCFAGWTTYGVIAGVCQPQCTALILNHFFGTTMNAAWGIAFQVNSASRFIATSVLNAMNPQIMKAEGNGNRAEMLALASKESKFSAALMLIVAIPILMEMPNILSWWLSEVPDFTVLFCRMTIFAFVVDQLTIGLHAANQATGIIRNYTLINFTPKILFIPISWFMLRFGYSVISVMWVFVLIELIMSLSRIPFLKVTVNLDAGKYIKDVVVPLIPLIIMSSLICYVCTLLDDMLYRFMITLIVGGCTGIAALWYFTLSTEEKDYVTHIIRKISR